MVRALSVPPTAANRNVASRVVGAPLGATGILTPAGTAAVSDPSSTLVTSDVRAVPTTRGKPVIVGVGPLRDRKSIVLTIRLLPLTELGSMRRFVKRYVRVPVPGGSTGMLGHVIVCGVPV